MRWEKQLDELLNPSALTVHLPGPTNKDAVAYLESAAYDELLDDKNPVKDFCSRGYIDAYGKCGTGRRKRKTRV